MMVMFFDIEYPEMPNDDERVDPKQNSDQRSQSDSSSSFVSGKGVNTADFPAYKKMLDFYKGQMKPKKNTKAVNHLALRECCAQVDRSWKDERVFVP
ncbi:hypothetical protein Tco_0591397 [Tanacetum coccineum]